MFCFSFMLAALAEEKIQNTVNSLGADRCSAGLPKLSEDAARSLAKMSI
jgi:hypothetical protein